MHKSLVRIIALLLVPCFLADPLTAAVLIRFSDISTFRLSTPNANTNTNLFTQEAFIQRTLWHIQSLAGKIAAARRKQGAELLHAGSAQIWGPMAMSNSGSSLGGEPVPEIKDSQTPTRIPMRLQKLVQRLLPAKS